MDLRKNVRIFGKSYMISGEHTEEEIERIARYVDGKMKTLSKMCHGLDRASLAVLASVNIAEELMLAEESVETTKSENREIKAKLAESEKEISQLKQKLSNADESIKKLKQRTKDDSVRIDELKEKCKEYEASLFDMQMEAIKLKGDVDKRSNE